jgi:hypothetical protein
MNKTQKTIDDIAVSAQLTDNLKKTLNDLAESSPAITINEKEWTVEINLAAFNVDAFMYSSRDVNGHLMIPVSKSAADDLTRKTYMNPGMIIGCMIYGDDDSKQSNAIYAIINDAVKLAEILEMNYRFISRRV